MANIGSIEPFSPESIDWTTYYDRVEQYFDANAIDDDKKVATVLTLLGPQTYKLLADLLSPAKPKSKPLADLEKVLSDHFAPKPLEIAERYRFHKRDQQPGESVSSYVAELRRLARQCNFGDNLGTTLRDRFVCGLHSVSVCKALLSEKDLTLTTALAKATSLEVASCDALELAGGGRSATSVNVLRTKRRFSPRCERNTSFEASHVLPSLRGRRPHRQYPPPSASPVRVLRKDWPSTQGMLPLSSRRLCFPHLFECVPLQGRQKTCQ